MLISVRASESIVCESGLHPLRCASVFFIPPDFDPRFRRLRAYALKASLLPNTTISTKRILKGWKTNLISTTYDLFVVPLVILGVRFIPAHTVAIERRAILSRRPPSQHNAIFVFYYYLKAYLATIPAFVRTRPLIRVFFRSPEFFSSPEMHAPKFGDQIRLCFWLTEIKRNVYSRTGEVLWSARLLNSRASGILCWSGPERCSVCVVTTYCSSLIIRCAAVPSSRWRSELCDSHFRRPHTVHCTHGHIMAVYRHSLCV